MTTRYVDFCSFMKLPCAWKDPKTVVLCLQDAALVVQPEEFCDGSLSTIEATVCQVYTDSNSCQSQLWHYKFQYDSALLTNPTVPLASSDITGVFCKDCLTTWIEEQNGSDVTIVTEEDGSQTLVSEHGCEYPIVASEVPFTVSDTSSIDLTVNPTAPQNLSGVVKISADAGNIIAIQSDGLFAEIFFSVTTAQLNTLISGHGLVPGATYEINDFVQGRIVAGAKVYVEATSTNQITSACSVLTTYDTKLWRGVYNVTTNLLIELSDNQGNTCRQIDSLFTTCIEDFDWGNTCYQQCLVDNAFWLVDYGIVGAFISNVRIIGSNLFDGTQLDMRGWAPGSLYDVVVERNYQIVLIDDMQINKTTFTNTSLVGGFSSFISNKLPTRSGINGATVDAGSIVTSVDTNVNFHNLELFNSTIDTANMTGGVITIDTVTIKEAAYIQADNTVYGQFSFCLIVGSIQSGPFNNLAVYLSNITNVNNGIDFNNCFIQGSVVTAIAFNSVSLLKVCKFTCGSTTTITNGSDLTNVSNNIGTIKTNGHDLTNVYVNGAVTVNCGANNTNKAKDYFNDNTV